MTPNYYYYRYGLMIGVNKFRPEENSPGLVFNYCVGAQSYEIPPYCADSTLAFIPTPAQMLIWIQHQSHLHESLYYRPRAAIASWFIINVGADGHDYYFRDIVHEYTEPLYFEKRRDALNFIRYLEEQLKCLKYPDHHKRVHFE